MRHVLGCLFVLAAGPAAAYEAPPGCVAAATVRMPDCLVRQVSACEGRSVSEFFLEGEFVGRITYAHPAMAVLFEFPDGGTIEHRYGAGAPAGSDRPPAGARFAYSHDVVRSTGGHQAGDRGSEEMAVGETYAMTIGTRQVTVTEIGFTLTAPADDYVYRERAFLLADPPVMLGRIGATYDMAGNATGTSGAIPAAISLPGDPDFGGMAPAPGCYR